MASKVIAILGSARSDGDTFRALYALSPFKDFELIDLNRLSIEPYRYDKTSPTDDFLPIAGLDIWDVTLEPVSYLTRVIERLPHCETIEDYEELLPA